MLYWGRGGALIYASQRFIGIDFGEATTPMQRVGIEPLRSRFGINPGGVGLKARRQTKSVGLTIGSIGYGHTTLLYAISMPKDAADFHPERMTQLQLDEMGLLPRKDFQTAWGPYGFGIACPIAYRHLIESFADALADGEVIVQLNEATRWQDRRLKVYCHTPPARVIADWEAADFDARRRERVA